MSHYKWGRIQKNIICLPERGFLSTGSSWQRSRHATWLHAGQQHPMSPELALSSACCPGRDVTLFWGGFDGPQQPSVSTLQGWRSASPGCGAGTGGKWRVLAKFVQVITGRAGRLLLWRYFMTFMRYMQPSWMPYLLKALEFPIAEYHKTLGYGKVHYNRGWTGSSLLSWLPSRGHGSV